MINLGGLEKQQGTSTWPTCVRSPGHLVILCSQSTCTLSATAAGLGLVFSPVRSNRPLSALVVVRLAQPCPRACASVEARDPWDGDGLLITPTTKITRKRAEELHR